MRIKHMLEFYFSYFYDDDDNDDNDALMIK